MTTMMEAAMVMESVGWQQQWRVSDNGRCCGSEGCQVIVAAMTM